MIDFLRSEAPLMQQALRELAADAPLLREVEALNPWFIPPLVQNALGALVGMLDPERAEVLLGSRVMAAKPARVCIIMAGNLPMVGFHDLLMVLMAGHEAVVKLSSRDNLLFPAWLRKCSPAVQARIRFVQQPDPSSVDMLLYTGSDNSARYVSHTFGDLPHLLRKNRFSLARLTGTEDAAQLALLAADILLYHGMGCRNVSTILLPEQARSNSGFLASLTAALDQFPAHLLSPDWRKVVSWEKAAALMLGEPLLPCRHIVIRTETALIPARVGCLHLVWYRDEAHLTELEAAAHEKIQCEVSPTGTVLPGTTQHPSITDFADGVDVLEWLTRTPGK